MAKSPNTPTRNEGWKPASRIDGSRVTPAGGAPIKQIGGYLDQSSDDKTLSAKGSRR
jgi:hypothetical protein